MKLAPSIKNNDWNSVRQAIDKLASTQLGTDASPTFAGVTVAELTLSSMTPGSVLFAETGGVISQDNINLFYDDVNNRLGIGTATPGADLDVAGHIWQTGIGNSVFLGEGAGENDDLTDNANVFVGRQAGRNNTTGSNSVFVGHRAGYLHTTGHSNSFFGYQAGYSNTTGYRNSFFGYQAGYSNTTGKRIIVIGYNVGANVNIDDTLNIGNLLFGTSVDGSGVTLSTGNIGIGVIDPDTKLEIFKAGNQLKLSYDATDNCIFAVDTSGILSVTPSGGYIEINGDLRLGHDGSSTIVRAIDNGNDILQLQAQGTGAVQINYGSGTAGLRVFDGGTTNSIQILPGIITDTSGTISFDNEHLTTTGNITGVNAIGTVAITASGTGTFGQIIDNGLIANKVVFTDGSKQLTSTPIASGDGVYWNRTGTTLTPSNVGDSLNLNINQIDSDLSVVGDYLTTNGDIESINGTIKGAFLTDGTTSISSGNYTGVGTIDFGTNTILDGQMTGNWAMNGGSFIGVTSLTASSTVQAEQITSTDDITMQGHLLTMGNAGSATDTVLSFLGSTNSATITFDESEDTFVFGTSKLSGSDLDISAGTGDYTGSGDVTITGRYSGIVTDSTVSNNNFVGKFRDETVGTASSGTTQLIGIFGGVQPTMAHTSGILSLLGLSFSVTNNQDIGGNVFRNAVYKGLLVTSVFGSTGKTVGTLGGASEHVGADILTILDGTINATIPSYGIKVTQIDLIDDGTGTITSYGLYLDCAVSNADLGSGGTMTSWGLFEVNGVNNALAGNLRVGDTNAPTNATLEVTDKVWIEKTGAPGAGNAGSVSHDGTNLIINPAELGGGILSILTAAEFNSKIKLTAIGGYAIKLTNKTGGNTVVGQIVKADTATDDGVILTAAGDDECLGVFLDSGIADGSEAWVVVSGIADVAMEDNTAATHGNWVETSDSEAGYADATSATPVAAPAHFEEIGHCIETVAAGGGGTHILARCVLHFN